MPTYLGGEPRNVRTFKPDQQAGQRGGLVAVGGDLLVQHLKGHARIEVELVEEEVVGMNGVTL